MTKHLLIAAALSMFATSGCIDTEGAESDDSTDLSSTESNVTGTHLILSPYYAQHIIVLSRVAGTTPSISSRTDPTQERWTFVPVGTGTFQLQSAWDGYCIGAATTTPGQYVYQQACSATLSKQQWRLVAGSYGPTSKLFVNVGTGFCLDTAGNTDSPLMNYFCNVNSGSQNWVIQ